MSATAAIDPAATLPSPPLKRAGGTAARFWRKGVWGLADQALISLTNFATMVLLARGLGVTQFGVFTLVYGALLFGNSLQGALITQPLGVLSASRRDGAYTSYTFSTAIAQLLFALICAAVCLVAAFGMKLAAVPGAALMAALAPCAIAWQLQEFVRRVLYSEERFRDGFINDVISYGGQTAVIAALWWHEALTGSAGLFAIAATSGVAVLIGVVQIRRSLGGRFDRAVIIENWHFGKWLAAAELGYWFSSQSYLYLAGAMLGAAATGTLKAAYTIFGPIRILGFCLKTILPNRFARTLNSDGVEPMRQQVRKVYWSVAPLMAAYCLLIALFAQPILHSLFGSDFAGETSVLALYAIFAYVAFMAQIVGCALRAGRLTRSVFASQAYATLIALPAGWLIIKWLGVEGAVVGMILTSLVVNFNNWRSYRRGLRAPDQSADKSAASPLQSVEALRS